MHRSKRTLFGFGGDASVLAFNCRLDDRQKPQLGHGHLNDGGQLQTKSTAGKRLKVLSARKSGAIWDYKVQRPPQEQ